MSGLKQLEQIYSGSVKDIYKDGKGNLFFEFSDRYSIFDWGKMPDLIPNKGIALGTMANTFFNLLEKHCGEPIEQVVQEIRSLAMPLRISRQLGLRPDALALQLLRRYITKDGVIIASFNWHPADQFVYKMTIDSNRGAANK